MHTLRQYLKTHPTRIKYGLFILDLFAMMIALKMYNNYINIQSTIENTIFQRQTKMAELAFSQNFLTFYERSDYARFFLQHENNMLSQGEYIIKLESGTGSVRTGAATPQRSLDKPNPNLIKTPEASWKKFLEDTLDQ